MIVWLKGIASSPPGGVVQNRRLASQDIETSGFSLSILKKEEQFRTNQFSDPKLVQARIVLKQILYLAKPCFCFCGKGYV
jgi:hypothetical protein